MAVTSFMIVDLTRPEAVVRMIRQRGVSLETKGEFSLPWAVAFKYREEILSELAGEELREVMEGDDTVLFDRLHEDLPRIQNPDARNRIIKVFWETLHLSAIEQDLLIPNERPAVHVIVPYQYPQSLLEALREVCARDERGLPLRSFLNEAVATVVGFVRSQYFSSETSGMTAARICLMATDVADDVTVVCFEYRKEMPTRHFIRIHDYFRTTCASLAERVSDTPCMTKAHGLFSLASAELGEVPTAELERVLSSVAGPMVRRNTIDSVRELRMKGATHLAACCLGQGEDDDELVISAGVDLGIQLDRHSFCPVVRREALMGAREYPYEVRRTFELNEPPEHELEVNLYGGFSNRIEDSILLSSARISVSELMAAQEKATAGVTVTVKLETVGRGSFRIDHAHDNRVLASGGFTLPGLIA